MGTLVIGTLVDRARRTLLELKVGESSASDIKYDRTLELLPLANAAIRCVCVHKPSAYMANESFQLASGAKQTLPAGARWLGNVEHNLGIDGATPGKPILLMDRATLSRLDPDWMTATGSYVEGFVYDQRDEKTFYVYPRPAGTWYVNLSYPAIPAEISVANIDSGQIAIDDTYDTAIVDFIVGYALLKNSLKGDTSQAAFHLSQFESATGIALNRNMDFAPLDEPAAMAAPNALGKP